MIKRQVFFSFHYANDSWRAGQLRNIGTIEGQPIYSDNSWETVRLKNSVAIKSWISKEMDRRSCIVVLIGSETSTRPWVRYEIEEAWKAGKGIVGIYIHNLKDSLGKQCKKGENPFNSFCINKLTNSISIYSRMPHWSDIPLTSICKSYDPPLYTSTYVYDYIKKNIGVWIEEAIEIRNKFPK